MAYRLLTAFEAVFRDGPYRHRRSTQGDSVAAQFYEDLMQLGKSARLTAEIREARLVVNNQNKRRECYRASGGRNFR